MRIHLRTEGRHDAPTLLLLHGTSSSLHCWDGWVSKLEDRWRIVRLDLAGFGLTGPWAGAWTKQDYTAANEVDFVLAVMNELGIDTFTAVGNSFGGEIAWLMAARHPERVSALVLINAAGYPNCVAREPWAWYLLRVPMFYLLGKLIPLRPFIHQGLRLAFGQQKVLQKTTVDRLYELSLFPGNMLALVNRLQRQNIGSNVAQLADISAPTLIIWGKLDKLIPLSFGIRFHTDITSSKLAIFDLLGHMPHLEDFSTTADTAEQFLTDSLNCINLDIQ